MHSRLARSRTVKLVAAASLALLSCLLAACGSSDSDTPAPLSAADLPTPTASPLGAVLVVLADRNFQDTEYAAVKTALLNAGYAVVVGNGGGGTSTGSDGLTEEADVALADADPADYVGVVLIGGPGATQFFDDPTAHALVKDMAGEGKAVGAICLAPVTLARAGILQGKKATVWPDNKDDLAAAGCDVQDDAVVVDGQVVTGNGPDAAHEFAQAFVTTLSATPSGPPPAN